MSVFRHPSRIASRSRSRRQTRRGEQLERRLALALSVDGDMQAFVNATALGHPQSHSCGCAGCAFPTPDASAVRLFQAPAEAQFPLTETFRLNSRSSASKRIYLDFNGHVTQGTIWQTFFNYPTIDTPAFSLDANYASFSDADLTAIQDIWARVAEDFAPFDVNVTTEEPSAADLANTGAGDTRWGMRVVVGGDGAWLGSAAGVAVGDSFGESDLTPAFAFADQWWKTSFNFVAGCISHEVGHTLGLDHHGYQGSEYYGGRGDWGPLMGNPDRLLTQWSRGDYAGATRPQQDDLSIITGRAGNGFGYRQDDHGNTLPTATTYTGTSAAGVIERSTDVDLFRFYTASRIEADVQPATIGANLDVLAEILDATGTVVATSDLQNALTATFRTTVSPGTYYLRVQGTGKGDPATTGYSRYGSLGQYTISMTVDAQPRIISVLDDVGATQGVIPNNGRTDDRQPVVTGSGAPGAQLTLSAGSSVLGTTTVSVTGGWSIMISPPLLDGTYTLSVRDSLGGAGDVTHTITVDTTPPPQPVLVAVRDDRGSIVGVVPRGGATDDAVLQLEGSAEAGATVTVLDNGSVIGTTSATSGGAWSFNTATLSAGLHSFTCVARDAVGNESSVSSPAYQVTVDLTAPTAPAITGVTDAILPVTGSVSNGGRTNDRSPLISGAGEPGSQVRVVNGSRLIGTAIVGGDGTWVLSPTAPLPDGRYNLVASASDDVGNASGSSAPFVITVDTGAPTVRITRSGSGTLRSGSTTQVTFTLSEPLTSFTAGHVQTIGGSLTGFTGSGTVYRATFVPTADFQGVANVTIPAGALTDLVGYPNESASLLIPVDTLSPSVTVSRNGAAPLIAGETATVVFTFTEVVSGFDRGDIDVTGGTLGPLQALGGQLVAVFTPAPDFRGQATITVRATRFNDAAGNPNVVGNALTIEIDTVIARLSGFTASPASRRLGIGDSVDIEATFTDPVMPGGRFVTRFDTGGQAEFEVDLTGLTARGTYLVQAGEQSNDLDVVSLTSLVSLRSLAGNPVDLTLPGGTSGLAARHQLVVDGAVKFTDAGMFSTTPNLVRDVGQQYRQIPIRFTTPVQGLSLNALMLSVDERPVSLATARLTGGGDSYLLQLPLSRVNPVGIYRLSLRPGSGIRAISNGAAATETVSLHWGFGRSVGMVPSAPTGVAPTQLVPSGRQTALVLGWQAPAGNGGGPVTHYLVEHRLAGTTRWIPLRGRIAAPATTAIIPSVTPNRAYEFRVAAVNAAGIGAYAQSGPINLLGLATIQAITPAAPTASRPSLRR